MGNPSSAFFSAKLIHLFLVEHESVKKQLESEEGCWPPTRAFNLVRVEVEAVLPCA
jgi:hypothetical protein